MSLRALVGVKRVVDYAAKVYVHPNKKVEAAVRLKEQKHVKDIIAVSIGCDKSADQLRTSLALGVDKGILIKTPFRTDQLLQPLAVAKIFKKIVEIEKPHLVILGKQAIDSDSNQVGQILAALLDWPQITFCSSLEIKTKNTKSCIIGAREIDQGIQQICVPIPAVVTCDLRLNKPRYATLPNVIKARKKQIEIKTTEELGVDVSPRLEILSVEERQQKKQGVRLSTVDELIEKLTKTGIIS